MFAVALISSLLVGASAQSVCDAGSHEVQGVPVGRYCAEILGEYEMPANVGCVGTTCGNTGCVSDSCGSGKRWARRYDGQDFMITTGCLPNGWSDVPIADSSNYCGWWSCATGSHTLRYWNIGEYCTGDYQNYDNPYGRPYTCVLHTDCPYNSGRVIAQINGGSDLFFLEHCTTFPSGYAATTKTCNDYPQYAAPPAPHVPDSAAAVTPMAALLLAAAAVLAAALF
eukprot:TRINITY_DN536_c0_g1_i1.p1 TRINITY_DN536_c0_g1~~TRINITY_DN536_c0_g1_i1.p1  ORF type:complete len:226 (-),score=40.85 TRINITY_DN536_c0_g1_i1:117-794(-)